MALNHKPALPPDAYRSVAVLLAELTARDGDGLGRCEVEPTVTIQDVDLITAQPPDVIRGFSRLGTVLMWRAYPGWIARDSNGRVWYWREIPEE
jgi:hypothetical protein